MSLQDISNVIPERLWFGAMPDVGTDFTGTEYEGAEIVVCRGEIQDPQNLTFKGASWSFFALHDIDSPLRADHRHLFEQAVKRVEQRVRSGQKTIVVCRAGLNRSGLVVGLVLKALGGEGPNIPEQLRICRPASPAFQAAGGRRADEFVLQNKAYENVITQEMPAGTLNQEDSTLVWNGAGWEPHGLGPFPEWNKANWPKLVWNGEKWIPYLFLFISTPVYDGTAHNTYIKSVIELQQQLQVLGVQLYFSWPRGDGIARCRNRQLSEFLNSACTHYISIDADIGFRPQHLIDMITCNLDVVFGAYPAKGYEWQKVVDGIRDGSIKTPEQAEKQAVRFVVNFTDQSNQTGKFNSVKMSDGRTFVEIKEGSTGFMAIRRAVIEKMVAAYPERCYQDDYPGPTRGTRMYDLFHMGMDPTAPTELATSYLHDAALAAAAGSGSVSFLLQRAKEFAHWRSQLTVDANALPRYLSEDYGFCRLWQKLGGKIYCYLGATLSHTGQAVFEGSFGSGFSDNPVVQEVQTNGPAQQEAPVQPRPEEPGLRKGLRPAGKAKHRRGVAKSANGVGGSKQSGA